MFAAETSHLFGMYAGGKIYSIMFFAIGLSSLSGFIINNWLLAKIGYLAFFMIACGLTIISLILLFFFKDEVIVKDLSKSEIEEKAKEIGNKVSCIEMEGADIERKGPDGEMKEKEDEILENENENVRT